MGGYNHRLVATRRTRGGGAAAASCRCLKRTHGRRRTTRETTAGGSMGAAVGGRYVVVAAAAVAVVADGCATEGPVPMGLDTADAAAMEGWSVRHDAYPNTSWRGTRRRHNTPRVSFRRGRGGAEWAQHLWRTSSININTTSSSSTHQNLAVFYLREFFIFWSPHVVHDAARFSRLSQPDM